MLSADRVDLKLCVGVQRKHLAWLGRSWGTENNEAGARQSRSPLATIPPLQQMVRDKCGRKRQQCRSPNSLARDTTVDVDGMSKHSRDKESGDKEHERVLHTRV